MDYLAKEVSHKKVKFEYDKVSIFYNSFGFV